MSCISSSQYSASVCHIDSAVPCMSDKQLHAYTQFSPKYVVAHLITIRAGVSELDGISQWGFNIGDAPYLHAPPLLAAMQGICAIVGRNIIALTIQLKSGIGNSVAHSANHCSKVGGIRIVLQMMRGTSEQHPLIPYRTGNA